MNLASKRRDKTSKVAPRLVVLKHTLGADFKNTFLRASLQNTFFA